MREISGVYAITPLGIGRKVRLRENGKARLFWHKDPFHPTHPGVRSKTYYGRLVWIDGEEFPHFQFDDKNVHDRFMRFFRPQTNVYPDEEMDARAERTRDFMNGDYDPKKYLKGAKSVKELF